MLPSAPDDAGLCLLHLLQAQAEIDAVMGDRAMPSLEDYGNLKYVMRCLCESMRLYPHPPVLLRRALVEDKLPGRCRAVGQDCAQG